MEMMEPAESMGIYPYTSGTTGTKINASTYTGKDWFTASALKEPRSRPAYPLANNIVALILIPKLTAADDPTGAKLSPNYSYDSSGYGQGATDPALDSKNQLPPVVQVTMVAVDDASYNRKVPNTAAAGETPPAPDLGWGGLFDKVGDLKDASTPGFAQDLASFQTSLMHNGLVYRVFTSNVSIRGAKWSQQQTK